MVRLPHHASTSFALIHIDVWGFYRVPTHDGKRYFMTVVDDHTKFT